MWATDYFTAMLAAHVPNVEIHIYAEGHHPGDKVGPDEPPSTGGLTDRGFIPYGTWQNRFIEWFQNLGFLGKPGVETKAAKDVAAYVSQPPPRGGRGAGGRGRRGGGAGTAAASGAASTAPASSSAAAPQASTPANP
jgi:hypothetical protein